MNKRKFSKKKKLKLGKSYGVYCVLHIVLFKLFFDANFSLELQKLYQKTNCKLNMFVSFSNSSHKIDYKTFRRLIHLVCFRLLHKHISCEADREIIKGPTTKSSQLFNQVIIHIATNLCVSVTFNVL